MSHDDSDPMEGTAELSLWQTAKGDFAAATGLRAVGLVALLLWMAFQWGPGNDMIVAPLAANTFDFVDNGESWTRGVVAALITGLVAGAFWALAQAIDTIVVLSGLQLIPGITRRLGGFLNRRGWVSAYADMRWSTRWMISYATGPSVLCVVDVFATGRQGVRTRASIIVVSVLLASGTVAIVVSIVAGAAMAAVRVPAIADEADVFVRYAKNPLTWIVIFGVIFAVEHRRQPSTDAA